MGQSENDNNEAGLIGLIMVRACACHDSHGTSWDKDGNVTETYEVTRCVKHADVPSIYESLRPPLAK